MPLVLMDLNVESDYATPETERYVVAITLAYTNASQQEIADCAHRVTGVLKTLNDRLDILDCCGEIESLLIELKEEGRRAFAAIAKA